MAKIKLLIFLLVPFSFAGCGDNEKDTPDNTVYVMLEIFVYEFFESPVVSTFSYPDEVAFEIGNLAIDTSSWYHDGVIRNSHLFTLSTDRNLRKINLNTGEVELTRPLFQHVNFQVQTDLPLMATFLDQVVVAGIINHEDQRYLNVKFYDRNLELLDSMVFTDMDSLSDIKTDGQNLYLSLKTPSNHLLLVMDVENETGITTSTGGKRCSELVLAGDTLLAVLPDEVLVFQKSSLEVLTTMPIDALQDASTPHDFFAYDPTGHQLYFLAPAADNDPGEYFHYFLSALDLKTGEVNGVASESEHHSAPLHFDARLGTIIVRHNSGFSLYTREGQHTAYVSPYGAWLNKLLVWKE